MAHCTYLRRIAVVWLDVPTIHHSCWVELLRRSELLRDRVLIAVLSRTVELWSGHGSILRRWRPRWLLLWSKEWCILRTNIETFRIVSALLSRFCPFALSRPILHRDGAGTRHLITLVSVYEIISISRNIT